MCFRRLQPQGPRIKPLISPTLGLQYLSKATAGQEPSVPVVGPFSIKQVDSLFSQPRVYPVGVYVVGVRADRDGKENSAAVAEYSSVQKKSCLLSKRNALDRNHRYWAVKHLRVLCTYLLDRNTISAVYSEMNFSPTKGHKFPNSENITG